MSSSAKIDDALARGRAALSRGAWSDGRAAFAEALQVAPSAEAWEGSSWANWWLEDVVGCLEAREHAFRLYRDADDALAAARMALWIGDDHIEFRGAEAVAEGWFGRAARLLDGLDPSPEHGWLAVFEAHALLEGNDPVGAMTRVAEARELGSRHGSVDLEMFSLATEGLVMIDAGEIEQGMRCLDEASASALAGEFENLAPAAWTCCRILSACERVRDFDRGAQWCQKIEEFSVRMHTRFLTGVCRAHYAAILTWRGNWAEGERELEAAVRNLSDHRPYWRSEAVVRLADLRRRQGRLAQAEELFTQAAAHLLAPKGLGELHLDRGEPAAACEVLERCLRRLPPESRLARAWPLEVLVRALIALGDHESASARVEELRMIAAAVPTPALRAASLFADGLLAAATADHEAARQHLEEAVDLLEACRTPIECARARLELARTLLALDQASAAQREARAALACTREVGALAESDQALVFLSGITRSADDAAPPLTARQLDVLRLVAQGCGDKEIATRLLLSEHTVHRHIANIYTRLGCSTRAGAVAQAGTLGLL
jgi:ATP/maltotriose-dependent transcriptional regulator MalT